jgi:gamma-glutamylcyclotransferase (GGCT)/AIG2-like uncharacterized protein YtfP
MNTNSRNMELRGDHHVQVGTGTLPDFELAFKFHCDVVRAPGVGVEGVIWHVTQRGLTMLDEREGYPDYYDRQVMWIKSHEGGAVKAWVYVMSHAAGLEPPTEGYWNTVVEGYREHGLSTHQLEVALDKSWAESEERRVNSQGGGDQSNGYT